MLCYNYLFVSSCNTDKYSSIAIVGSGIGVVATNISIGVGSGVEGGTDIGLNTM